MKHVILVCLIILIIFLSYSERTNSSTSGPRLVIAISEFHDGKKVSRKRQLSPAIIKNVFNKSKFNFVKWRWSNVVFSRYNLANITNRRIAYKIFKKYKIDGIIVGTVKLIDQTRRVRSLSSVGSYFKGRLKSYRANISLRVIKLHSAKIIAATNKSLATVELFKRKGFQKAFERTLKASLSYRNKIKNFMRHLIFSLQAPHILKYSPQHISKPNRVGYTLLHLAVLGENRPLVKKLLKKNANVNALFNKSYHVDSPLSCAFRIKDKKIRKMILEKNPNLNISWKGNTYMHNAAQTKSLPFLNFLISKKLNINVLNNKKVSPLEVAIVNRHAKIAKKLLQQGAKTKTHRKDKVTLLHFACHKGMFDVVKLLLKKGASLKAKEGYGRTALHYAAASYNPPLVRFLIRKGLKVSVKDRFKRLPLHYACISYNLPISKIFLSKGSNINARDYLKSTPLHYAAKGYNQKLVKYLIEKGADKTIKDKTGKVPGDYGKKKSYMRKYFK